MREMLHKTREDYESMDRRQKIGFVLASTATTARIVLGIDTAYRGLDKSRGWRHADTVELGASFLTDRIDGDLARRFNAQTTLGSIIDPLADKATQMAIEAVEVWRGEEAFSRFALRVGRDSVINATRIHFIKNTGAELNVGSHGVGKLNTTVRMAANVVAVSPFGERHPRIRSSLQTASTLTTLASGAITFRRLYQSYARHKHS